MFWNAYKFKLSLLFLEGYKLNKVAGKSEGYPISPQNVIKIVRPVL